MKIEYRKLCDVRPYAQNPRRNEAAVDAVAQSILDFGFRKPIVVDADGVIICGHTCLLAAKRAGLSKVPVHVADDLTPDQVSTLRIADNKTAELAEWDWDLLADELSKLEGHDIELEQYGFSALQLAQILRRNPNEGLIDVDQAPPLPTEPITRPGDLWILGEHRLMCGDSAKSRDVIDLVEGRLVDCVNTDPPYGVAVQPRGERAADAKLRAKDRPLLNDALDADSFARKLNAWFYNLSNALAPGRAFYIWGGYSNFISYPGPLQRSGLHFAQHIVWVKNQAVLSRQDFNLKHESCFYGWREGAPHQYFGPNDTVDVWEVKKVPGAEMVHLTQKPVELATRALEYSTRRGERVLDLFGGSGTTLMAAEQLERKACLMELDPLYCDVIVRRWEEFTGRKAQRIAPGAEVPRGETKTEGRGSRGTGAERSDATLDRSAGEVAQQGERPADRSVRPTARPTRRRTAER